MKRWLFVSSLSLGLVLPGCGADEYSNIEDWWHQGVLGEEPTTTGMVTQPAPNDPNSNELQYEDDAGAGVRITNLSSLQYNLNLKPYHDRGYRGQNTTVAILDNGFMSLDKALGKTLPPNIYKEAPIEGDEAQTLHGTKLAELVYSIATGKTFYDATVSSPELRLYVTNGPYRNLENAITKLVQYKYQNPNRTVIALYSQIWEYGGNLNGTGYINELVNRAIDAGIIWVNAAGNLGKGTYFSKVDFDKSTREMKLPAEGRYLKFKTQAPMTPVKIVLGWQDFSNSYYFYYTKQDLDLVLENDKGKEIGRATLIQDGQDHGNAKGYSRHAREVMQVTLIPGTYRIRVLARSDNFDANSRFWVTTNGPGVEMENSNGQQVVFMPADNPRVFTVGAFDVDYGNAVVSEDGKVTKPDFLTWSLIQYASGAVVHGTSTAAAVAAGAFALYRSAYGSFTADRMRQLLDGGSLTNGYKRNPIWFEQCRKQDVQIPSYIDCKEYGSWLPPPLKLPNFPGTTSRTPSTSPRSGGNVPRIP